jgi:hypothetical protein
MSGKEALFDTIPGYREAVIRERYVRASSFIDAPELICGIKVRPLAVSHLAILDSLGNAFVTGGKDYGVDDICAFLWVVSLEFKAFDIEARDNFVSRLAARDAEELAAGIVDFLVEAFQDSPQSSGQAGDSFCAWVATYVDTLASEYGWGESEILAMPLKRVFQYIRLIRKRNDPKVSFIDPSDKVRLDWLESLSTEQEKTAE